MYQQRGGHGEGGRSCHGTRGGQRVATHPLSGLPSMPCSHSPAPAGHGSLTCSVRGALCFFCVCFLRGVCRDAHPTHPKRAEGGKDCSDDHVFWICCRWSLLHSFRNALCPCSAWMVASVITPFGRHTSKLISSSSPPPSLSVLGTHHVARMYHGKDTASTQRSTSKQQPR